MISSRDGGYIDVVLFSKMSKMLLPSPDGLGNEVKWDRRIEVWYTVGMWVAAVD